MTTKKFELIILSITMIIVFSMPALSLVLGCGSKSYIYTGELEVCHSLVTSVSDSFLGIQDNVPSEEWGFSTLNCKTKDKTAVKVKKCIDISGEYAEIVEYDLNGKEKNSDELSEASWPLRKDNAFKVRSKIDYSEEEMQFLIQSYSALSGMVSVNLFGNSEITDIQLIDDINDYAGEASTYDYACDSISEELDLVSEYYCLLEVKVPSKNIAFVDKTGGSWYGNVSDFTVENLVNKSIRSKYT